MKASPVEFLTKEELQSRREKFLEQVGLTEDQLLEGEFKRTLTLEEYLILDEIRGIDFLLTD